MKNLGQAEISTSRDVTKPTPGAVDGTKDIGRDEDIEMENATKGDVLSDGRKGSAPVSLFFVN